MFTCFRNVTSLLGYHDLGKNNQEVLKKKVVSTQYRFAKQKIVVFVYNY